jgi:type VII secretion protein EccCb
LSRGFGRREPEAPPEWYRWSRVLFRGDEERRRTLAGEVVARLAAAHAPDEMVVVLRVSPQRRADWAWTRWLPHLSAEGEEELLVDRPPFEEDSRPDRKEPLAVIVVDGLEPPAGDRRGTVVLDLSGTRRRPGRTTLRVDAEAEGVRAVWAGHGHTERSAVFDDAAPLVPTAIEAGRYGLGEAFGDWPPPLDASPTLEHLLPPLVPTAGRGLVTADPPEGGFLTVPVGVVDRPFERVRGLLRVDLSGERGHVLVIGDAGTGRTTLVTTLVAALALTGTAREVQFYCVGFGGSLDALAGLPHVGTVADERAPDRVGRTIAQVTALLTHRERLFADHGVDGMAGYRRRRAEGEFGDEPYGDVFLVVDDAATLRRDFAEHAAALECLAARGLDHGVHLVLTAADGSELDARTFTELRLDDPARPGYGRTGGLVHRTALPRADGVPDARGLAQGLASLVAEVAEYWAGRAGAPDVRVLPDRLSARSLPPPDGGLRVVLGLADGALTPVAHDFVTSPHLMIIGKAGSGRTNLLALVAQSITATHTPGEARILITDRSGDLQRAVPEDFVLGNAFSPGVLGELIDGTARAIAERVPGPWHGPRLFVLVDDYEPGPERDPDPFEPILEYLPLGYGVGVHLVVARSADGAADAPLTRGLRDAGSAALSLSGSPAGRGRYRAGDETLLVQTALAERL